MFTRKPRLLGGIRLRNRSYSTLPELLVAGPPAPCPTADRALTLMSRLVPSIDELAGEVRDAAGDDAAIRLRAAIGTGRELTKIGDALVERFVVEARMDGLSWAQIGQLAGTSKRAAQKRYAAVSVLAGAWPGELADRFAGP
jgi:hypothetical protein